MTTTVRPSPSPPGTYAFPRFEEHRLDNGLRILIAPVNKLPLVTILAIVDAGAESEPAGFEGMGQIAARLLTEGAGQLDGATLSDKVEGLGSALAADADWDSAAVSMSIMSERLDAATGILADVLIRPLLPAAELERLKAEREAELLLTRTEPRSLADEMFAAILYDRGSRYGRPVGGSASSIKRISREAVADFHARRYTPGNTTIVVVGDVDAGAIGAIAKHFGEWTGEGTGAARPRGLSASHGPRGVHLVEKAGAPQSELRIGQVGLSRNTTDYFDVVVMNAILGGLFSSRINLNLREKHGYTYGAFSHFEWRREAGPFVVSSAVRSDVSLESIREVLSEIDRMRTDHATDDEMSLAVDYLAGVFPIRFETTAAIASALASIVIYGLPIDFYDRYRGEIGSVTKERVLNAARKYLRADAMEIVVVGDPEVVREPLEQFAQQKLQINDPAEVLD